MDKPFSPREFLKARRPERFSDSVYQETRGLDRSVLEYHLDSLTSRNQETDFANFARELCKREICPNILPQTGPTGGGDSKADAETYPVAEALSLVWYTGAPADASSERWAFAFSTKKKWREKVASDIEKIASTNRGYTKAFFVTNQFVRDKLRGEVEDELRKKYGLDVRILDRTWILDRVFTNGHQSLAGQELKIVLAVNRTLQRGPLDTQRERDLEEIEMRITTASQQNGLGDHVVEDCIEAAILARTLDRPRAEVDGRFERAERLAQRFGTFHQKIEIAYQRAWTTYWWYEDVVAFPQLYGAVEDTTKDSDNAYHLGLLTNLWLILYTLVKTETLSESDAALQQRTKTLTEKLATLSKEEDRPANALEARTELLRIRLLHAPTEGRPEILKEAKQIILACDGLAGFPLEPFAESITELGNFIGEWPGYDDLFETLTATVSARTGEISAARMLTRRGAQLLDADNPYEALRLIGRAIRRLHRHESRHDAIRALCLIGSAYDRVGLKWAARGSALYAASLAMQDYSATGDITPFQASSLNLLKWFEIKTGRLSRILEWHEFDSILTGRLTSSGYSTQESLEEGNAHFDAILGILLLRADIPDLRELSGLPDVLDSLALFNSAAALRFALGHEAGLPHEWFDGEVTPTKVRDHFVRWRDQPVAKELREKLSLGSTSPVTLKSSLLGCDISVRVLDEPPLIELAESFLAALESVVATGLVDGLTAREPVLTIEIVAGDELHEPFEFQFEEQQGRHHAVIKVSRFDPSQLSIEMQTRIKDRLVELIAGTLARILLITDLEHTFVKLFRDDRALERAIVFTTSFMTQGKVLGHQPKTRIGDWSTQNARPFPLLRDEPWDGPQRAAEAAGGVTIGGHSPVRTPGPFSGSRPVLTKIRHSQMQTVSIIRELLWNRAGWCATLFLDDGLGEEPPALAPVFRDKAVGGQIFELLRQDLGPEDQSELLRVAIIRGIDRTNPHAYRVVIGPNQQLTPEGEYKLTLLVNRINTMTPSSSRNLDRFLHFYAKAGAYTFIHAVHQGDYEAPEPVWENAILKRQLVVRYAWEIGRNDLDVAGIRADDNPVIPPDRKDAPVLELLRWMKERSKEKESRVAGQGTDSEGGKATLSAKDRAERRKANRKRDKQVKKRKK